MRLLALRGRQFGLDFTAAVLGLCEAPCGGLGTILGLLECRGGHRTRRGTDTPARPAEAIARCGDHHRIGIRQCGIDCVGLGLDAHGTAEQLIEQWAHTGSTRADMGSHRIPDARRR